MAAIDKCLKSLETLKTYISSSSADESANARSKEKIALGVLVTDMICSPDARDATEFQFLFAVAMETLLKMTDDPDSNIRMIADECLNRVVRAQIVVNAGKVTAELHKEIKRNGAARSVRAALWRFAELVHLIKPAQGKAYVRNLVPCLKLIAARKEEPVLETLATALPKIMKSLGCFMSDNEAKDLLQDFMDNLKSDNAVVRRTAATSIVGISANCPNSRVFVIHTLTTLLDFVIPVNDDQSVHMILGVLNCIRGLIPHLDKTNGKHAYLKGSFGVKSNVKPTVLSVDTVFQAYELCLHWTDHEDHNVITAALETLHELLVNPPEQLVTLLLDSNGLSRSRIHCIGDKLKTRTLSQLSVGTSSCAVDESQLVEDDLITTDKVTEWLSAASVGGAASLSPSRRSTGGHVGANPPTVGSVSDYMDSESIGSDDLGLILKQEPGSPEPEVFSGHDSPSPPLSHKSFHRVMQWDIGSVTESGNPLLFYCARRLVSGFLVPEHTKARVSVRSLALNNLCQVVRLCPDVFTLTIDKNGVATPQGVSHIFDVIKYSSHSDPQLRGLVTFTIGQYIHAKYNKGPSNSEDWFKNLDKELSLKALFGVLLQSLKDESSVCIRHAITASGLCIPIALESNEYNYCIPVIDEMLRLMNNSYWLVKVKVVEFLGMLPYVTVHYVTGNEDFQKKVVESLIVLLTDEDSRVRKAAGEVMSKLIKKLYFPDNGNTPVEAKGVELNNSLFDGLQKQKQTIIRNIEEGTLSRMIHLLVETLMTSSDKHASYGCIEALYRLSEDYLPVDYPMEWQCLESAASTDKTQPKNCLLSLVVTFLTKSSLSLDLECHHWLLILAGKMFSGKLTHLRKHNTVDSCPGVHEDLLVHIMRTLGILTKVMEDKTSVKTVGPSPLRKKVSRAPSPPSRMATLTDKDKEENKRVFGAFSGSPQCLKMSEVIRAGFTNYRLTLDPASSEKFLNLVSSALKCTELILPHCNPIVSSSLLAEELLQYLNATFMIDPTSTIRVANQLLKNLMEIPTKRFAKLDRNAELSGFYAKVFQKPQEDITSFLSPVDSCSSPEQEPPRTTHTVDLNVLAMRIKLFEGIVIQSLKVYMITSNVHLQVEVLALLTQLVQLKVNYYLLDAGQIFVQFVKKQFEFLEKGQIKDPELLIPQIFKFLVHLSNDKNHSKPVISVPEIIQLCDGLLASGRNPVTHCIPALLPIVEHVFLNDFSNIDVKELETEREVIFNMLIRLAEYPQVLDILLRLMKDGWRWEDHWKRWYRKTVDTVLPLLAEGKLLVNDMKSLLTLLYLNENFCAPLNKVLVLLFSHQQESQTISQWMGMLAAMLISVCVYKEERVLLQLEEMNLYVREEGDDPLKVNAVSKTLPSSVLLSKLVLRVVVTSVDKLNESIRVGRSTDASTIELARNLSTFLLCWTTVFRLGKYQEVSKSVQKLLTSEKEFQRVNEQFAAVAFKYPRLALIWIEMISLLGIGDNHFWKAYITAGDDQVNSLNGELIQRGCVLFFCEYLANHPSDTGSFKWILSFRARDIIWNCQESPVEKFIASIFHSEQNSEIFLDNISQYSRVTEPIFVHRMLRTLENIHSNLTGRALFLVATSLARHKNIGIARLAAAFCCRTVEYLLLEKKVQGLSSEELLNVYKSLACNRKRYRRHNALLSLLKKLSEDVYSIPIHDSTEMTDPKSAADLKLDKNWYLEQIKQKCSYSAETNGMQCARLLSEVQSEDEVVEIMTSVDFDKNILQHCFSLGTLLTLQSKIEHGGTCLDHLVHLYKSARCYLLHQIHEICDSLASLDKENRENSIDSVLTRLNLKESLYPLVMAVVNFFESLNELSPDGNLSAVLPRESHSEMCRFALICAEVIVWILERKSECEGWPSLTHHLLACCAVVFSYDVLSSHLRSGDVQTVRVCLLRVHKAITGKDMRLKELNFDPEKQELIKRSEPLRTGVDIGQLLNWIEDPSDKTEIPRHFLRSLKSVIISLGRIQNINWLWSVPPEIWQFDAESNTPLSVPFHFLQDSDILQQIVNRIRLLGWTGRQQFEEAWVCLLGTFSRGEDMEESDPEEAVTVAQAKALAIEGITWLVLSTLTMDAGRTCSTRRLRHVPRLDASKLMSLRYWKRLEEINELIKWKIKTSDQSKATGVIQVNNRPNLDRLDSYSDYGFGQLSVGYLQKNVRQRESVGNRGEFDSSAAGPVDIRSCIQFVLDLYEQWTQPNSGIPLNLQFSMVKSIVCLSDLFIEESHFQWMLDTFTAMIKSHSPQDENIHQYLILGTAKAAAVLEAFEGEIGEQVLKFVEFGLKSNLNLLKTASLQGILYLLQSATKIQKPDLSSEIAKQSEQEFRKKLISLTVEYILGNFNVHDFYSSEIVLTMDLACYFAEEYADELTQSSRQLIKKALTEIACKPRSHVVYQCAIHGWERLVLVGPDEFKESATRLALDRLSQSDPLISLPALKLLVACIYSDKNKANSSEDEPAWTMEIMEKTSALFDKIKKGYPIEVEIVCQILPRILSDFFPVSDVSTKVIGEFLSPNQPHKRNMADTVFQVFSQAIQEGQLPLLQDWIVHSLNNFTHNLPAVESCWSLCCFFICASDNPWLRALFPHVQSRIRQSDQEDRLLLCIAALQFYNKLSKEQKAIFLKSFRESTTSQKSAFSDILACIE